VNTFKAPASSVALRFAPDHRSPSRVHLAACRPLVGTRHRRVHL